MKDRLIEMKNISKEFPGVLALDKVDFDLKEGEVHALVGQNGAGKSTLIKVLTGVHSEYSGKIIYKGEEKKFKNPQKAQDNGIRTIYQEIELLPNLNVAENVFLGHEPKNTFGKINKKVMHEKTNKVLEDLNIFIDTKKKLGEYSVAIQQMVAIARAVNRKASVVVMDEPTSALDEHEVKTLFEIIRSLKEKGIGIIYISHRMEEIFHICDRVTVLRDSQKIDCWNIDDINELQLINAMLGKKYAHVSSKDRKKINNKLLEIKNYNYDNILNSVSIDVGKGEILGLAGLVGSGRSETMKCLIGILDKKNGETVLKSEEVSIDGPSDALKKGIAYLPEDRKTEGLVLSMSVADNIILSNLKEFSKYGIIDRKKQEKIVRDYIDKLSIKTPSSKQIVKNLSGGNQQKVVLAKILLTKPELIILDEPTRGIDIGAKKEIFSLIKKLASDRKSIILISSELNEVVDNSDRIYVIHEGEIIQELKPTEAITEDRIYEEIANVN